MIKLNRLFPTFKFQQNVINLSLTIYLSNKFFTLTTHPYLEQKNASLCFPYYL